MKLETTNRGFSFVSFIDYYDSECSLQKSSLATEDAIWFGVDKANPMIMARDAEAFGVKTEETTGWVPFPVPEEVLLTTRMHLTRDQVKDLIPVLQRFVETGEVSL